MKQSVLSLCSDRQLPGVTMTNSNSTLKQPQPVLFVSQCHLVLYIFHLLASIDQQSDTTCSTL